MLLLIFRRRSRRGSRATVLDETESERGLSLRLEEQDTTTVEESEEKCCYCRSATAAENYCAVATEKTIASVLIKSYTEFAYTEKRKKRKVDQPTLPACLDEDEVVVHNVPKLLTACRERGGGEGKEPE